MTKTTSKQTNLGWIGVDLDGTLARHQSGDGVTEVGEVIEPMLYKIQQWLDAGIEVRIFTARASRPELVPAVEAWLEALGLPKLAVTNRKDFDLLQIWDDRAIQIEANTGNVLTPREYMMLDISGWIGVELDGTLAHFEKGMDPFAIGEPVQKMRLRVQQWLMAGIDVRLFTARATLPAMLPHIEQWLQQHQMQGLKITAEKDFAMSQFWDDRGVHVVSNSGNIVTLLDSLQPEPKFR